MLRRNIAGFGNAIGLVPPSPGNPFAYGTEAGQIGSPVNVQSDTGPSVGYITAQNILTGSVAGDQTLVTTPPPVAAAPNQVSVTNDSGISVGTLLLMAGAVGGTIYLLTSKRKSRAKVTGTKKGDFTVPVLLGAGALALYFLSRSSGAPAPAPGANAPVAALPQTAMQTIQQKLQQL